jgi:hypothetical protein
MDTPKFPSGLKTNTSTSPVPAGHFFLWGWPAGTGEIEV